MNGSVFDVISHFLSFSTGDHNCQNYGKHQHLCTSLPSLPLLSSSDPWCALYVISNKINDKHILTINSIGRFFTIIPARRLVCSSCGLNHNQKPSNHCNIPHYSSLSQWSLPGAWCAPYVVSGSAAPVPLSTQVGRDKISTSDLQL